MAKAYLVVGFMNTGSGSLTFPEDFDFIAIYMNEAEADKHAAQLNRESGAPDPDAEDYDENDYDPTSDEMRYETYGVELMTKAPKGSETETPKNQSKKKKDDEELEMSAATRKFLSVKGRPLSDVKVKRVVTMAELPDTPLNEFLQEFPAVDSLDAPGISFVSFTIPGYGSSARYGLVYNNSLKWFWDRDDGWQEA
jgi:hypothetical protein